MKPKRYETYADFEREEMGKIKRFYECMEEIMDEELFRDPFDDLFRGAERGGQLELDL